MDFINDVYPVSFEGVTNNIYKYRFISIRDGHEITKVVSLRPFRPGVYNLGFGNLEYNPDGTIRVNDTAEINNGDYEKVLATVFACLLQFLYRHQDAQIIFFGNTEHKQLIYKRKIAANLDELQEWFLVKGGYADMNVRIIEKEQKVLKKAREVTRIIREKDPHSLKVHSVHAEIFNVERTKDYQFVLIALRDVL